ncbi:MAG TPA: hypothetical protein VF980_20120 [Thermoanaerobaculia bacterium]
MPVRYRTDNVTVTPLGERPATWTFAKQAVSGIEYSYSVVDGNMRARNGWEFVVRVPRNRDGRMEVRPVKLPNITSFADLDRRSLTFKRATRQRYRGSVYCPVALADPSGQKSRTIVSDKSSLPRWFEHFETRKKETVASTRGTDAESLVLFCAPSDHPFMIRAFFACKVWVMREGFAAAA